MLSEVRAFFAERKVLEVDTPLLGHAVGSDPQLHFFTTELHQPGGHVDHNLYLQTSPEFAMKRLLAAGSGAIYQLGKAFRNEEQGRYHNPEFTMLEWYRPGWTLTQLIDEVTSLISCLLAGSITLITTERLSYRDAFLRYAAIDPLTATIEQFQQYASDDGLNELISLCGSDRTSWLDALFSHRVQPQLGCEQHSGRSRISFIDEYPAAQASLARIRPGEPPLAERFEVFINGIELANGFHELADAEEQRSRFDHELRIRAEQGRTLPPLDENLLAALASGLPDCCGVALGIDRLLMLRLGADSIDQVIAFPLRHA